MLNNNEPCDNEACDNKVCDNEACDNEEKSRDQLNLIVEASKCISNNINKMHILIDDLRDEIFSDDARLKLFELNKINALADESLDCIWNMIYGKNREKNKITNIDKDKDKDIFDKDKDILFSKENNILKIVMTSNIYLKLIVVSRRGLYLGHYFS